MLFEIRKDCIFQAKTFRVTLLYDFANLFSVWLNRRQLGSHICFCIQSVVISHILEPLENATVYLEKHQSEEGQEQLCIIMKIALTSQTPWKGLGDHSRGPWTGL